MYTPSLKIRDEVLQCSALLKRHCHSGQTTASLALVSSSEGKASQIQENSHFREAEFLQNVKVALDNYSDSYTFDAVQGN